MPSAFQGSVNTSPTRRASAVPVHRCAAHIEDFPIRMAPDMCTVNFNVKPWCLEFGTELWINTRRIRYMMIYDPSSWIIRALEHLLEWSSNQGRHPLEGTDRWPLSATGYRGLISESGSSPSASVELSEMAMGRERYPQIVVICH